MTFAQDQAARFKRPQIGAASSIIHDTETVGVTVSTYTLSEKTVAFRMVNGGSDAIYFRLDGVDPTVAAGYTLPAGADTGWIDCVGGGGVKLIAAVAAQRVDICEVLQ